MVRVTQKNRIDEINKNILMMADLVENQIFKSVENLRKYDPDSVENIIKDDDNIDDLHQLVEEECIIFIATEQPLAKDLRYVFMASKIATDLERMGDHAVDICKVIKSIGIRPKIILEELAKLCDMEEEVRKMINLSVNAYIRRDYEAAYEICKMDDAIDELYNNIFNAMLKLMRRENIQCDVVAQLLFIAKYLERIGDRVTNICEGIIFAKKGTYVDLNE